MNRGPIRSPARSASNLEFHASYDHSNEVARKVVTALEERGIQALNPSAGFPMERDRFPGRIWVVSHKPVAVAAGLGRRGVHRNVIHPKFGNFIVLGPVLLDAERRSACRRRPRCGSRSRSAPNCKVVKAGSALGYVECDVADQAGKLVARASSTCMKLRQDRPPTA